MLIFAHGPHSGMCHSDHFCVKCVYFGRVCCFPSWPEAAETGSEGGREDGAKSGGLLSTTHPVLSPSLQPGFRCFCPAWEAVKSSLSYALLLKWSLQHLYACMPVPQPHSEPFPVSNMTSKMNFFGQVNHVWFSRPKRILTEILLKTGVSL